MSAPRQGREVVFDNRTKNIYGLYVFEFEAFLWRDDAAGWPHGEVRVVKRRFQGGFSKSDSSSKVLKIFEVKKTSYKL